MGSVQFEQNTGSLRDKYGFATGKIRVQRKNLSFREPRARKIMFCCFKMQKPRQMLRCVALVPNPSELERNLTPIELMVSELSDATPRESANAFPCEGTQKHHSTGPSPSQEHCPAWLRRNPLLVAPPLARLLGRDSN